MEDKVFCAPAGHTMKQSSCKITRMRGDYIPCESCANNPDKSVAPKKAAHAGAGLKPAPLVPSSDDSGINICAKCGKVQKRLSRQAPGLCMTCAKGKSHAGAGLKPALSVESEPSVAQAVTPSLSRGGKPEVMSYHEGAGVSNSFSTINSAVELANRVLDKTPELAPDKAGEILLTMAQAVNNGSKALLIKIEREMA